MSGVGNYLMVSLFIVLLLEFQPWIWVVWLQTMPLYRSNVFHAGPKANKEFDIFKILKPKKCQLMFFSPFHDKDSLTIKLISD